MITFGGMQTHSIRKIQKGIIDKDAVFTQISYRYVIKVKNPYTNKDIDYGQLDTVECDDGERSLVYDIPLKGFHNFDKMSLNQYIDLDKTNNCAVDINNISATIDPEYDTKIRVSIYGSNNGYAEDRVRDVDLVNLAPDISVVTPPVITLLSNDLLRISLRISLSNNYSTANALTKYLSTRANDSRFSGNSLNGIVLSSYNVSAFTAMYSISTKILLPFYYEVIEFI